MISPFDAAGDGSSPRRASPRLDARSGRKERRVEADSDADPGERLHIRIHFDDLLPEDVTVLHGIPVTKPARTLLDLATVADDHELESALTEALKRNLTNRSEIHAVIARYPQHLGGRRLRTLIGDQH